MKIEMLKDLIFLIGGGGGEFLGWASEFSVFSCLSVSKCLNKF